MEFEMEKDENESDGTSNRGFASMDEDKQREIASKGGKSQGKDNNPANFANDREKAAAAGRIGGQNSHGGGRGSEDSEE
jgi:general stress protein YciG